jgi:hypothetical protein
MLQIKEFDAKQKKFPAQNIIKHKIKIPWV